jgi:4-hydroxy-tetrahydrodipicolinate reductase
LPQADVLIEFTHPEPTLEHLKVAVDAGKAMVIGTTGLNPTQVGELKWLAEKTRVVFAPNMSVGVNLMFKVVEMIAGVLSEGYDVEIVEAHHRLKKDAPSGTAIKLAQVIAQALGRDLEKTGVYARHGIIGQRTDQEIGIQTVRAGDITGEHTVLFGGIGERLEVIHRAHNRDNFAKGAVRAALWIVDQEPGLYDMQDVLGLK